jgi:hypothetical protein
MTKASIKVLLAKEKGVLQQTLVLLLGDHFSERNFKSHKES